MHRDELENELSEIICNVLKINNLLQILKEHCDFNELPCEQTMMEVIIDNYSLLTDQISNFEVLLWNLE